MASPRENNLWFFGFPNLNGSSRNFLQFFAPRKFSHGLLSTIPTCFFTIFFQKNSYLRPFAAMRKFSMLLHKKNQRSMMVRISTSSENFHYLVTINFSMFIWKKLNAVSFITNWSGSLFLCDHSTSLKTIFIFSPQNYPHSVTNFRKNLKFNQKVI